MPTVKKTVIKVDIHCGRCKKNVLKIVTKLQGINSVVADAEKGTLTVVGEVDPVSVVKKLTKAGKFAEIVTVGPPKPPEPKLVPVIIHPNPYYDYTYVVHDQGPSPGCTIV